MMMVLIIGCYSILPFLSFFSVIQIHIFLVL